MPGDSSRSISLESITVTAAGTLFTSTPVPDSPVPDSGVREKTSIVGSTTVALESAGAAGAFWASAEDAPNAKTPKAISEKASPLQRNPPLLPSSPSTPLSLVVFIQRRRNGSWWTDRQGRTIESCILFPFLSAITSKLAYPSIVRYYIYSNNFRADFRHICHFIPAAAKRIVATRLAPCPRRSKSARRNLCGVRWTIAIFAWCVGRFRNPPRSSRCLVSAAAIRRSTKSPSISRDGRLSVVWRARTASTCSSARARSRRSSRFVRITS